MNKQIDKSGNYFLAPKSIFSLGLSSGEITLYLYLMFCEDRSTYKCYPSYSTIGKATGMSNNTVRKYVESLKRRGLIFTEHTTVITKDGRAHNGSLRYTINPIQPIEEMYFQRQLREANTRRKLIEFERRKQGEGSLFQRKDGRWEGRVMIGYNEKGNPKTKSVFAHTKGECEEKLERLKAECGRRNDRMKPDMNFGDWMDLWYQYFCKPRLRITTQACYEGKFILI